MALRSFNKSNIFIMLSLFKSPLLPQTIPVSGGRVCITGAAKELTAMAIKNNIEIVISLFFIFLFLFLFFFFLLKQPLPQWNIFYFFSVNYFFSFFIFCYYNQIAAF